MDSLDLDPFYCQSLSLWLSVYEVIWLLFGFKIEPWKVHFMVHLLSFSLPCSPLRLDGRFMSMRRWRLNRERDSLLFVEAWRIRRRELRRWAPGLSSWLQWVLSGHTFIQNAITLLRQPKLQVNVRKAYQMFQFHSKIHRYHPIRNKALSRQTVYGILLLLIWYNNVIFLL